MTDLDKLEALAKAAIDAFDRLYVATIGNAERDEIRQHYGTTAAFEIITAKQDLERTRSRMSARAAHTGEG